MVNRYEWDMFFYGSNGQYGVWLLNIITIWLVVDLPL